MDPSSTVRLHWNERGHLWLGALLPALWVLSQLDAPIVEDSLFWWIPKALMAAEQGPRLVYANALPTEILHGLDPRTTPNQWDGGLPDYGHPPLWYWFLGLFLRVSPSVEAIHIACLLPAVMIGTGFAALGAAIGSRWSGLSVLCLPPVLAQLLRPELDLPLLAVVPWALLALIRGQWMRFAVLGILASWIKEPGVLLCVPAIFKAWQERRLRLAATAPLLGLMLWAVSYGRLASPEHTPSEIMNWLHDLWSCTKITALIQGRFLILFGLFLAWNHCRSKPRDLCLSFVLFWILFFSFIGFLGGRGPAETLTPVRYLLPGMAVLVTIGAARWPVLALVGLFWLPLRSPFGPEASIFGVDMGRAEARAASWLEAQGQNGAQIWVGSYTAAGLTQPWSGITDVPLREFHIYDSETRASDIPNGAIFVEASYGEPVAAIKNELQVEEIERWEVGEAFLVAWRVQAHGNYGFGPPNP